MITAALRGAGSYGKTTLTQGLCHDPDNQDTFRGGILWVTLGDKPANLVAKIEELIYLLCHERPGAISIDAAMTKLSTAGHKFVAPSAGYSRAQSIAGYALSDGYALPPRRVASLCSKCSTV